MAKKAEETTLVTNNPLTGEEIVVYSGLVPDLFSLVPEDTLLPPDLNASDFVGSNIILIDWQWKEHKEYGKFFTAHTYVDKLDEVVVLSFFSWMAIRQLEGVETLKLKPPFSCSLQKEGKSYRLKPQTEA